MQSLIKNFKISNSFIAVILPSLVVSILLAGTILIEEYSRLHNLNNLEKLTNLSVKISTAVHEQQKEKGLAAGFLGSKGQKFKSELNAQYQETNKQRKIFLDLLKQSKIAETHPKLKNEIQVILNEMNKIDTIRGQINSLNIELKTILTYYSELNDKMLELVAHMAQLSPSTEIATSIVAYSSFMQAKERLGTERAVGTEGFARGQFSLENLAKFQSLIVAQNSFMLVFNSYSSSQQKKELQEILNNKISKDVQAIRDQAINSQENNGYVAKNASNWFNTITKKINLFKGFEDSLAKSLQTQMASIKGTAYSILIYSGIGIVVMMLLTTLFSTMVIRAFLQSTNHLIKSTTELADGNLETNLPEVTKNEFGSIVKALHTFRDKSLENKKLLGEKEKEKENIARLEKAKRVEKLIEDFDQQSARLIAELIQSAEEMNQTSNTMNFNAEQTVNISESVSSAANEASSNVANVASATEELTASIKTIAEQSRLSNESSQNATSTIHSTQSTMDRLNESAQKINEVVTLITNIAEQTNLLALNATIESARAGEAGKGFAVVANEVKALASETQKATSEIAAVIQSVQSGTNEAVDAIGQIRNVIEEINDSSASVSEAMQEQTNATQEIAHNIQRVSQSTSQVTGNIEEVNSAAHESGEASNKVLHMAESLKQHSNSMKDTIERFLADIRSA